MSIRYSAWLAAVLTSSLSVSAAAEDKVNGALELVSGPPEQCVSLIRIDRTEVIDDQNILFYMKGGDIYRNYLPHRCPGLASNDTFMYRTSLSQLCHLDIITVLQSIGFGFSPGVSCGLGRFYPVSEEDAELLEAQRHR